jgi:hypothetical protein
MKRVYKYDKKLGKMVEITGRRVAQRQIGYPYTSEAMAIDTEDHAYAQQVLKEAGVRTEYVRDEIGLRPVIRDRAHRKAHCEAMGFYDRDAGYGDASPQHFSSDFIR